MHRKFSIKYRDNLNADVGEKVLLILKIGAPMTRKTSGGIAKSLVHGNGSASLKARVSNELISDLEVVMNK